NLPMGRALIGFFVACLIWLSIETRHIERLRWVARHSRLRCYDYASKGHIRAGRWPRVLSRVRPGDLPLRTRVLCRLRGTGEASVHATAALPRAYLFFDLSAARDCANDIPGRLSQVRLAAPRAYVLVFLPVHRNCDRCRHHSLSRV